MSDAMTACSLTPGCRSGSAPSSASSVPRWNASGKPWITACGAFKRVRIAPVQIVAALALGEVWHVSRARPSGTSLARC